MILKFVAALHEVAPIKRAYVQRPEGTEFTRKSVKKRTGTEIQIWLRGTYLDTTELLNRATAQVAKRGVTARWKNLSPGSETAAHVHGSLHLGRKTIRTHSYTIGKNTWVNLHMNEDLRGNRNKDVTPAQIRAFLRRARAA